MKTLSLMPLVLLAFLVGCATPKPWPQSPLYPSFNNPDTTVGMTKGQFINEVIGKYGHYDVVAYEDTNSKQPMKTFVISYGITEFFQEGQQLMQKDVFCRATHKINYKSVTSSFDDAATQAIIPKIKKVDVTQSDGKWQIYRGATPTLLGVKGDNYSPLKKRYLPNELLDADGDGNPGVTVDITIAGFISGEIYMARREIFENTLTLATDGSLYGYVTDRSEQLILGASLKILDKPANPTQLADTGMSPLLLVPLNEGVTNCAELIAKKSQLFPKEPDFF